MFQLTDSQKGFLNYLAGMNSANCDKFSEEELEIIKFFDSEGLINSKRDMIPVKSSDGNFTLIPGAYRTVSISEKGKSFLVELKVDSNRYKHPLIINTVLSILAILISLAALTVSILSMTIK